MSTSNKDSFKIYTDTCDILTCKMLRYVNRGTLPSVPCKERDEVIEVRPIRIPVKGPLQARFRPFLFIFNLLTVAMTNWDFK